MDQSAPIQNTGDKSNHQKAAADQPHDAHGHFAAKPHDQPATHPLISTTTNSDPSLDAPLVSVAINNPFKKLLHWLDDIRKKQTTEFDINTKLKIPLIAWIALVGVLFGAFNITTYFQNMQITDLLSKALSKYSTTKSVTVIVPTTAPTPILLSRIGTLQATYQLNSILSPTPQISSQPSTMNYAPLTNPSRYVLVTNLDQITFLSVPPDVSLNAYLNKRVLVTGEFNPSTNTIQIRQSTDLQYLP